VAHKPDAKAINEGTSPRRGPLERDNELGQRIRELRMERSLSLAGLAARVGVTRSFLSSVERGVAYPSILVLRTIAAALEVPVFLLFTGRESSGVVVHRHERKIIKLPSAPVSYELISPDAQHRMEMIITHVRPGAEAPAMSHDGEECALVLRGHVVLTIGGIDYELNEGDSIYYNSGLPHTVRTVGDEEAEIVSAITPPSF
jgi:transcriptional regulator with XRE-family HTH domain